jgi:6-phosphogluconolactonase (cycloisomerase 2 family)
MDPNTGRLTLIPNQQIKDSNQTQLTFYPVGGNPVRMAESGSCIFTVNGADQSITPYSATSGQLTLSATSTIATGGGNITSINAGSNNAVYLTDAAPTSDSVGGRILDYTVGSSCSLNTVTGGPVNNLPLTSNPSFSMTDITGKWYYVLNRSSTDSQNPNTSSISLFNIQSNSQITASGGAGTSSNPSNPYPTGAGPYCMVEDPTKQYLFISNNIDGTVTGKRINPNTGELSDLQHNSTFPATGHATCLAISGNVD